VSAANRIVVPLRLSSWVSVAPQRIFYGQARLCPMHRRDLALLVEAEHHGMARRADIQADNIVKLLDKGRIVGEALLPAPSSSWTYRSPP
jgi:hypothetical protein